MSRYTEFSSLIDKQTTQKLLKFIDGFYSQSDTIPETVNDKSLNDPYLNYVSPSVTLKMGLKEFNGHEEVKTMRIAGWANFKQRKHEVWEVSKFNNLEYFVIGKVDYVLKNDKTASVEWAGKWRFQDEELSVLEFYHVYIDMTKVLELL